MKNHEVISSKKNPQIQFLTKLRLKKYREKWQLFIVEGQREIEDALKQGFVLKTLFYTEEAANHFSENMLFNNLKSICYEIDAELMFFLTKRDNAFSMLAIFEQKWATLPQTVNKNQFWIALESPKKPDNVGAIIRTAEAAGANGVILLDDFCDPFSMESIRASTNAIFSIPLINITSSELVEWKMRLKVNLIGTRLENGIDYRKACYDDAIVLLMGTEYTGLSVALQNQCDTLVYIPIRGMSNSLNVSVASGILLYEISNAKANSLNKR